jgi:hypothetical protein
VAKAKGSGRGNRGVGFRRRVRRALELAETQRGDYSYDKLYAAIAPALAARGETDRLISSLSRCPDDLSREIAFNEIARLLAEHGHTVAAKQIAQASGDPDRALVEVCAGSAANGNIDHCIDTLCDIGVWGLDEASYNRLQRKLLRWRVTRKFILAKRTSLRYSTLAGFYRQKALKEILRHFRVVIDRDKVVGVAQALASANAISSDLKSWEAAGLLIPWLRDRGAADEAARMADRIKEQALKAEEPELAAKARCIVAEAFGELDRWQEALEIIEPLLTSSDPIEDSVRDSVKYHACKALARCARFDEAIKINDEMASHGHRAWALSEIVSLMLAHGEQEQGDLAAFPVLELADQVAPEKSGDRVFTIISYTYAEFGLTKYAIDAAKAIGDERERNAALETTAFLLLEAGAVEGAQEAACAISDYSKRRDRLSSLSRILLRKGNHEGALATASQITYDRQRAEALGECAKAILAQCTPYERSRWIERFLREARGFRGFAQLAALGEIGQAAFGVHEDAAAEAIAEEALEAAHSADAVGFRFYLGLARSCVEPGFLNAALAILPHWSMEVSETAPVVVRLLARLGRWPEADAMLGRISGLSRIHLLADLAEHAIELGEEERAQQYQVQVEQETDLLTARQIPLARARLARICLLRGNRSAAAELGRSAYEALRGVAEPKALEELAVPLARAAQKSMAIACLPPQPDLRSRSRRQTAIAKALADAGEIDDASEMAKELLATLEVEEQDSFYDDWVRRDCGEVLFISGQPESALPVVLAIGDAKVRVNCLIKIARSFIRVERFAEAEEVFKRVCDIINGPTVGSSAETRAEYASILAQMGRSESAQAELRGALRQAEAQDAEALIGTLMAGAPVLALIDQGQTLYDIARAIEGCAVLARRSRAVVNALR